jgi:hypothetical protein
LSEDVSSHAPMLITTHTAIGSITKPVHCRRRILLLQPGRRNSRSTTRLSKYSARVTSHGDRGHSCVSC